jgi:hypothetical protein
MSIAPIHSLPGRFSPVAHYQPRHAPIARLERSVDLLGAAPNHPVSYLTAAANALSGPDAAQYNHAPAVPLLAPGARFDAYA